VIDSTTDGPTDALHLGGGGFTGPGYLEANRPDTFNHVLEIDDVALDVARDELGPNMVVKIGDGRLAFKDFADESGITGRILNEIVIASDQPIPTIEFAPEDGTLVNDIDAFIDGGQVLCDDFAPVEQLAANPSD
jgi:hypothetical protein